MQRGSIVDAIRASSAIPGIVRPVNIHGHWLVDGSLVNPIPVSVCRTFGAHVVIAVNLNGDTYGKGATLLGLETDPEIDQKLDEPLATASNTGSAYKFVRTTLLSGNKQAAPAMSSVIFDSFSIVHDRIARARLMGDPPDLMIAPDLGDIGSFDVHRAEELIALGDAAAREQIPAIRLRTEAASKRIARA